MAEKRQKKQAVKAFEKETFSKDKEVTGAKHTEHRQDNTFPTENHFHANEKPVSNLPRDANHGSDTKNVTSGHNVQKSETGAERKTGNKKKYYRQLQQQQNTSGHNVQKSEADAEKAFLKENSFMQEEQPGDSDSTMENEVHVRDTYQRSEEKGKYHKGRVQREHAHRERAKSENTKQSDYGDFQTKDATFSQGQAEEFTDKKVQKAFDKSEKSRQKLQKAKDKMPKKRQYEMKRVFDEQTGKAKYVVVPVEVEKPFKPDGLGKAAVHKLQTENMYFVHRKIAETEKDNSAVEGAHKTEQRAEDVYHYMKYLIFITVLKEMVFQSFEVQAYDYDTYQYQDTVEDREAQVANITEDIRNGNTGYLNDFLNAVISEGVREGITDIFGEGVEIDDSEAVQTARRAKELLDKLAEYKPLAKVEELEEQNYNMIDNVLNNGAEKKEQEQIKGRISIKEKLAEKKAVIEQRDKAERTSPEKETEKKSQREM